MNDSVSGTVLGVFRTVFENKGRTPPALSETTALDGSLGFESLDFAEVVLRLEEAFGFDPFAHGVPPGINTIGDLIRLYAQRRPS